MSDRFKLTALLAIAVAALGALGIIPYNVVANDWRLVGNPLDLRGVLGEEDEPDTDDRTVAHSLRFVDSIGTVRLSTHGLRVRVQPSTDASTGLQLVLSGDATDSSLYRWSARVVAGELHIESAPTGALGNASGTLELSIPPDLHLSLLSRSADVSLQNIRGRIAIATSGASIELSGIAGTLAAIAEGGDIALDGCHLDSASLRADRSITLRLTEGPIRATAAEIEAARHFGALDADAQGSIRAEVLVQAAPVRLIAGAGDVHLRVLDGARFAYDVEAPNGAIVSNVPFDTLTRENATVHRLRTTMNGGGVPAIIRSAQGNVEILLFEANEPRNAETYVEDPSSHSRLALRNVQSLSDRAGRTMEGP